MIKEWMFEHVRVMDQLSRVGKMNKYSDEMESMFSARDERKNIRTYVDFQEYDMVLSVLLI